MRVGSAIFAGIVGALVGFFASLIGSGMVVGVLTGAITGGIVGYLFALSPRDLNDPSIAIESLSPAGFFAGITASAACGTGLFFGAFFAAIGWILGIIFIAIIHIFHQRKTND
jgi:ABC-type Co2+ transport system permease subunit